MKSRAALLHVVGQDWQVEEIGIDVGYRALLDGENIRGVIVHG